MKITNKEYNTWVKVPAIDEEIIRKALLHRHSDQAEINRLYKFWVEQHSEDVLNPDRRYELKQLISLYSFLYDTERDNPEYKPYLDTMKEMLNDRGLITFKSAGYPMAQFKSRSIERLAMVALRELYPNDVIEDVNSKGKNDMGIDLVWNGRKIDVKTTFQRGFITSHSNLGTIKDYALSDPTKLTDYILWTGNLLHLGYITLLGLENWGDVKEQIDNEDCWESYIDWRSELLFHKKKIKDFTHQGRFERQFLGNIDAGVKQQIIAAQAS